MEQGHGTSAAPAPGATAGGRPARRGRHKKEKPKMTKAERRAKYTSIAHDRRQAGVKRARDKGLVCYRCRKPGHSSENCTAAVSDGVLKKKKGSICYKCGSFEHRIQVCPKIQPFLKPGRRGKLDFGQLGELPFATCYVCHKAGHLAGNCPDSEKGVYPKGGACRECGAVDHYAKDCPNRKRGEDDASGGEDDASEASVRSATIDDYLEEPAPAPKATSVKKKKKKVVNF